MMITDALTALVTVCMCALCVSSALQAKADMRIASQQAQERIEEQIVSALENRQICEGMCQAEEDTLP